MNPHDKSISKEESDTQTDENFANQSVLWIFNNRLFLGEDKRGHNFNNKDKKQTNKKIQQMTGSNFSFKALSAVGHNQAL